MTLRSDELRAVEALVQFMISIYGESQVSWKEPEKDPPDADMTINGTYYPVEVTTIPEIYTLGLAEPLKSKAVVGSQQSTVKKNRNSGNQEGHFDRAILHLFLCP